MILTTTYSVLLWCRIHGPKVDLLSRSAQGSAEGQQGGGVWKGCWGLATRLTRRPESADLGAKQWVPKIEEYFPEDQTSLPPRMWIEGSMPLGATLEKSPRFVARPST